MKTVTLPFRFKGPRNYIQGADIYDILFKKVVQQEFDDLDSNAISHLNFSINKMTSSQLYACLSKDDRPSEENSVGKLSFTYQGERFYLFLYETHEAVHDRYDFDEENIITSCAMNGDTKSISNVIQIPPNFSAIEVLVAMNKALHQSIVHSQGKWVFTGLQLDSPVERNFDNIRIQLVSTLGYKLTKASVETDGNHRGHIYFSLLKQ